MIRSGLENDADLARGRLKIDFLAAAPPPSSTTAIYVPASMLRWSLLEFIGWNHCILEVRPRLRSAHLVAERQDLEQPLVQ